MRHERTARTSSLASGVLSIVIVALCVLEISLIPPVASAQPTNQGAGNTRGASHDLDRLFSEEMKTAVVKLKWHGERLTEDTVYAVALTGASWEPAWGKETMFSLAWGDSHKIPALVKRSQHSRDSTIDEIKSLSRAKHYRQAVDYATKSFSLDEISCDENLKDYVGASLLALGQPEQAFPIYAAPFEPAAMEPRSSEHNRSFRESALECARRAGLKKEAVAFSLSLLIDPDLDAPRPDQTQIDYLENAGVDVDRVLLGILQAPEKLRGLPAYYYAAADLMAYRASPRLFPFLLQLADSNDVYLRGRAILGLGMVAHQPHAGEPAGWWERVIYSPPREYGISAGERKLVDREIREGAASDKFRLRAMAALAMGLIGDSDYLPILQKLSKDRAYVLLAENGERSKSRTIMFPVRLAANAALARFGVSADTIGGSLSGRELDKAKHGGSDESNDHRNLRKDVASILVISPIDIGTGVPYR